MTLKGFGICAIVVGALLVGLYIVGILTGQDPAEVGYLLGGLAVAVGGLNLVVATRRRERHPIPDEPYRTPPVGEGPYD